MFGRALLLRERYRCDAEAVAGERKRGYDLCAVDPRGLRAREAASLQASVWLEGR